MASPGARVPLASAGICVPRQQTDAPRDLWLEKVTDAQLPGLLPLWEELAAEALEPNPFYEPFMLLPALRQFSAGRRLTFLCVFAPHPSRQKDRRVLCGFFPFEHGRPAGRLPVPMLSLWKHPWCYLTAPLLRRDCARAVVTKVFDWLAAGGRETGLVRLEDFPGDGPIHRLFVDELKARGWHSQLTDWYTRAVLHKGRSGEEYLTQALRGKRRKELRRQQTRLAELGRIDFAELPPGGDAQPWIKDFLALEAGGWKGRESVALLSQQGHAGYFEAMATNAFEQGRSMMLGLFLDGRPIALKHNLLAGESGFAFKIAYDERFARFSPGVLLELENVLRLHEREDIRVMDSCASWNRFMINQLWTGRREMQTCIFATEDRIASLVLALLPLSRWAARQLGRRRGAPSQEREEGE
jgi:hypothetical protein